MKSALTFSRRINPVFLAFFVVAFLPVSLARYRHRH